MSLIRIVATMAFVLFGLNGAMAEMPAPNPAQALALAEGAQRNTTGWITQKRADELAYCKTVTCHAEFDAAIASQLEQTAITLQYRIAERNSDVTAMKRLWDRWGEIQTRHEADARKLRKYYPSATVGSR